MYAIYGNIYHILPSIYPIYVSIYTIHGSYGLYIYIVTAIITVDVQRGLSRVVSILERSSRSDTRYFFQMGIPCIHQSPATVEHKLILINVLITYVG